jgi:hypothetical protein
MALSKQAKEYLVVALSNAEVANEISDAIDLENGGLDQSQVQTLIDASIDDLIDGAPIALDTLKELAAALGDDENFASNLVTTLSNKLTKGSKTIFCIDNGDFANGQAAIDAASQGDTILFGVKAGGWGDLVIPSNKGISLKGLQTAKSKYVRVGSINFSPTTGSNINLNEVYIENLFISSNTQSPIVFGGTVAARLRIYGCYISPSSNQKSIEFLNSNTTSPSVYSSAYLYDSIVGHTGTNTAIESSTPYVRCQRTAVDGSSLLLQLNAGTFESDGTYWECNRAAEIINIAGGLFLAGRTSFTNNTTNGSGILIGAAGVVASSYNSFVIATGTGYCVRGTGVHAYGQIVTANSALQAFNVKIQNTVTSVPYTTSFTPSA